MTNSRRNHTPAFKAKVALAAIKGDQTISGLADTFKVHASQIKQWKKQLLNQASELFSDTRGKNKTGDKQLQTLHEKIDRLAMENDFLVKALGQQTGRSWINITSATANATDGYTHNLSATTHFDPKD